MSKWDNLLTLVKNNKEIIENYFFMTILQVLNSFFYLLIYPFLIRTLGAESYGLYVFASSITAYFMFFVNFGFEMPAIKSVAENITNLPLISKTLSCVFTAKLYLFLISSFIFAILLATIPIFKSNIEIFLLCYLQVFSIVLFPQWYFQSIQKMKIVTYIQLGLKILSLPFIFLLIRSANELDIYVLIVSLSSITGGVIAFFIINFGHKLKIKIVRLKELKSWFKDGLPFFFSQSAGIIKEQSIVIIIGAFFGMKDVAIYDLANKIIMVPRTIFMSINAAIFPKLIKNIDNSKVKMIINTESMISLSVIAFIALFGNWIVLFMGGKSMLLSYPLSILLSVTVMTWLVVGAYISFVFIPNKKYFLVTKNQIIALCSFILYALVGLFFYNDILVFGFALALSGLTEIFYCKYVTKKYQML